MSVEYVTARVLKDGPLELRGPLLMAGAPAGNAAWLCRCGCSANKPWCDGSHRNSGCALTGDPPPRNGVALPETPAPVELSLRPNGPVVATGPLVMLNDAGQTTDRTTEVFLCRCGKSAKQPYCDGSHRRMGFVAP